MRAQMTKLTAVAAVAVGLMLGTGGTTTASTLDPCSELPVAGGGGNARARVIRISADRDRTPWAGYMVNRFFVGPLPA